MSYFLNTLKKFINRFLQIKVKLNNNNIIKNKQSIKKNAIFFLIFKCFSFKVEILFYLKKRHKANNGDIISALYVFKANNERTKKKILRDPTFSFSYKNTSLLINRRLFIVFFDC